MIRERVLLDDGTIAVADVRCVDAPTEAGPEETPSALEVVIPLAGVFLRTVRRIGRRPGATAIADPTRALVFRPAEPYRVTHPVGGGDRSLVITLRRDAVVPVPWDAHDRPVPAAIQLAARRLARALAAGQADELAGAEVAMEIVRVVGRSDASAAARSTDQARHADVAAARITRLVLTARLGERLSLEDLGQRAGLSGWELARRFRRVTGTSIRRYRTALRVQAALERIEGGERDLTGLALDLGFADHSHLTNVLRQEVGRPPSSFRPPPTAVELAALRTILQA